MWGWSSAATASASIWNSRTCRWSASGPALIIFSATSRLSPFCRALKTTPMPPWPSFSSNT